MRSVISAFQGTNERSRRVKYDVFQMNEPRKWLRLHISRYGEGRTDFVYKNIDDEVDIGKEPKLDVSEGKQETKKIGY